MAIPESLKAAFAKADFEAVEDGWIEHLGDDPSDIPFFTGTGRALVGQGREEIARMLFRLLDEELIDAKLWPERLTLLREAGAIFHRPKTLQAATLDCLTKLHGDHGRFDELIAVAGLHRSIEREVDLWRRVDRLTNLLEFDVGTIATMDGRGVVKIVEVNTDLESFRVEIPGATAVNVGFRAAAKLLTSIPPDTFFYRLATEPDTLKQTIKDEPHRILEEVLSKTDRAMTGAQIKNALAGLIPANVWARWWQAARKHPQVVAEPGARNAYRWVASGEDAEDVLRSRFQKSDLNGKLQVLGEVQDRAELLEWVVQELREQYLDTDAARPSDALLTYVRVNRAIAEDLELPNRIATLAPEELAKEIGALSSTHDRRAAYTLLGEHHPNAWSETVLVSLAHEPEPRLIGGLIGTLSKEEHKDAITLILRRASRLPAAFVWLAEEAQEDEDLRTAHPVLLLRKLISARSLDAFQPFRPRLASQFQSGGTVPKLLAGLGQDKAKEAHRLLSESRLASAERAGLIAALETRFPDLRATKKSQGLYALQSSIDQRREELRQLKEEELPANRKAVEEAAALGDLRENFEYKSARERQEYLSGRLAQLEADIKNVRPLDLTKLSTDEARIGSVVVLADGDPKSITILGPWESQPEVGIISYQSELGQALVGKSVGDRVVIGDEEREVVAIEAYSPPTESA